MKNNTMYRDNLYPYSATADYVHEEEPKATGVYDCRGRMIYRTVGPIGFKFARKENT